MKLLFSKSNQILTLGDRSIPAWSKVRNELNGLRKPEEVVYTEPVKKPYYPRRFPAGVWRVYQPVAHGSSEPYLFPWFIPTDAWQDVDVWEVKDGRYFKKTGATYRDSGYGLHFSTSGTTLGCIRIGALDDLNWLVGQITGALKNKEEVTLEVVE